MPTQEKSQTQVWLFLWFREQVPPVSVCGARRKQRLTKQTCFLPTAAHAAPSLNPPQAALRLAAIPNTEVKLICADNTWRATAWEDR